MVYRQYDRRVTDLTLRQRFFNHIIAMIVKMTEICLSVKVLGFVFITYVCWWLVVNSYIDGGNFSAIMISAITTIFGMREAFKISRIISDNNLRKIPEVIEKKVEEEIKKQSGSINRDNILNE